MPKSMEIKLMREAAKKGLKGKKKKAYVYGTMRKAGWKPSTQKKKKKSKSSKLDMIAAHAGQMKRMMT